MSMPSTPTKRILTEDAHSSFNASRTPQNSIISDDLTARLQNIGSRVRKYVSEGYTTQRFGAVSPVPSTPFSSPTKQSISPHASAKSKFPIFRSANDTLVDVFSSPTRAAVPPAAPSHSPRKRRRAEVNSEDEDDSVLGLVSEEGRDITMGMETSSDDDEVTIITNASQSQSPSRPIRPLKKAAHVHRTAVPHEPAEEDVTRVDVATLEWKDMFKQPF